MSRLALLLACPFATVARAEVPKEQYTAEVWWFPFQNVVVVCQNTNPDGPNKDWLSVALPDEGYDTVTLDSGRVSTSVSGLGLEEPRPVGEPWTASNASTGGAELCQVYEEYRIELVEVDNHGCACAGGCPNTGDLGYVATWASYPPALQAFSRSAPGAYALQTQTFACSPTGGTTHTPLYP